MKFTLTFKTPDVLNQATNDLLREEIDSFNDEETDFDKVMKTAKKFLVYDECISIEFDTDTQTAKVLEV